VPQNQEEGSSANSSVPAFTEQDRFVTLMVLHDAENAAFLLIDCDAAQTAIRTVAVPANTVIELGTEQTTLQAIFDRQGHAKAGQALSALLGQPIRYTAAVDQGAMVTVLDRAGSSIEYTFAEEITYKNAVGMQVRYREGERYSLSSSAVKDLLFYRQQSATERARLAAELFANLICQKMTAPSRLSAIFGEYIDLIDSNISIADFVAVKQALEHLARSNDGSIASARLQAGECVTVGGEERYYCTVG
jgi:anionic cell wall polymer biosynthesis LytR-Cps2A-Psr (LCP) family protein